MNARARVVARRNTFSGFAELDRRDPIELVKDLASFFSLVIGDDDFVPYATLRRGSSVKRNSGSPRLPRSIALPLVYTVE